MRYFLRLALFSLLVIALLALGYVAHAQSWHESIRPVASYLFRETGGCNYAAASSARRDHEQQLSKYHEVRAASKLIESTPDGLQHWSTPLGAFWTPSSTDFAWVAAEQLLHVYGDGVYRVRRGDVVLDCGANIGTFTREALLAGASLVIAIEPVPSNVESLRRTFSKDIAAGRVVVVPKGVWHQQGTLKMTVYDNTALASFVMTHRTEWGSNLRKELDLPLTTIDALVAELALDRVDFIKMDIEGAERNALRGARHTIATFTPRMSIATENLDDDYAAVPTTIREIVPSYLATCGPCAIKGGLRIRPEILYFQPHGGRASARAGL